MGHNLVINRYGRFLFEKSRHVIGYLRGGRRLHTAITFRAVVDAVIPATPELAAEYGPEHVPGGLETGLAEYLVSYVDHGFQLGLPHFGPRGTIGLAKPVAKILDAAALKLILRGATEQPPGSEHVWPLIPHDVDSPVPTLRSAGPFARLSPADRLRAIAIIDDVDVSVARAEHELFEFDGGLVGQLVVGFAKLIYYCEWQGYDEYDKAPSERQFTDDPASIQGWRQTGYPGMANGYPALRGYLGSDDGPLGTGEIWTTIDADADRPVYIRQEPGRFRENEYDTSDYEEVFPEVTH